MIVEREAWRMLDDADDECPVLINFPKMMIVDDAIHDLKIIHAIVDVAVDAQERTSIDALLLLLEGVSMKLLDVQTKLTEAIND